MIDPHETCKMHMQIAMDKIERLEAEVCSLQTILVQHETWCGHNPKNKNKEKEN